MLDGTGGDQVRMRFLLVPLLLLPTLAQAETKDFSVTDVAQIIGEWEGSYFVKPGSTAGTSIVSVKKNGTWESPATKSHGTFALKDGKVRFQVLSPIPAGEFGRYEDVLGERGKLSFKTERDDLNVTGEYISK